MSDYGCCAECGVSADLVDGRLPQHDRISVYTRENYGPCPGSWQPPGGGAPVIVIGGTEDGNGD